MRMYEIIQKKRNGGELTREEIQAVIRGYVAGEIPDYQVAALCMAIYFRSMTEEETSYLTEAIRDSGKTLEFANIKGIRADKHSTGGVGDKTSLVVMPVVASLGVCVAKMSGRGLGHTGGTVDKLEAIQGFQTDLPIEEFERIVNEVGVAIVGQSAELAPADKMLYALRDVTATVDSMPLIASSIMGKKLAANDDCIVLDVKTGSGAFMKSLDESRELARLMVEIGKRADKKICALITNMDAPLGNTIGNSLEVIEAIEVLSGEGPEDLKELCTFLAANLLFLAQKGSLAECEEMAKRAIKDKTALDTFARMVKVQGGDAEWIYHPEKFPQAPYQKTVLAPRDGYIARVDAEGYGVAALLLGAGRNTKDDEIDLTAGIRLYAKTGDFVKAGEPIAELFTSSEQKLEVAAARLLESTVLEAQKLEPIPLILDRIE